MHHFDYRGGALHAEDVDLGANRRRGRHAVLLLFQRHHRAAFRGLRAPPSPIGPALVCYAMKANSNQAVLDDPGALGAGMDVVSEGELRRARAAGVPGDKIIFSGVGKTARRDGAGARRGHPLLQRRIRAGAGDARPRSPARAGGRRASPFASIRTSTRARTPRSRPARSENKFGVPISRARAVYARARALPGLAVDGVDMHIGSQITDMQPFDDAFALLADFVRDAARRRPRDRPRRSRRRPRHPLSRTTTIRRRHPERLRRDRRAPHPRARLQARLRAGPADRRQRRRAGDRGDLRQARRRQELRHRRRGDERPHPPDALRRPSRDPAARRAGARRAAPARRRRRAGVRKRRLSRPRSRHAPSPRRAICSR